MSDTVRIVIDPDKCTGSGECMKVCPEGAIVMKDGKACIDPGKCDSDGVCVPACPNQAIKVVVGD